MPISQAPFSPSHQEFRCYHAFPMLPHWVRRAVVWRGFTARWWTAVSPVSLGHHADTQWALIDPLLPDPAWLAGKGGGHREVHCRRDIVHDLLRGRHGIKWRALPADF